jgi:hypothetical protein
VLFASIGKILFGQYPPQILTEARWISPTSFMGPAMVPARNHLKLVIGQILSLNLSSGDTIKQDCSSHGFEVSELCWGCCPLDSFKVTALLVNPTTRHWCKAREVLVSNW